MNPSNFLMMSLGCECTESINFDIPDWFANSWESMHSMLGSDDIFKEF